MAEIADAFEQWMRDYVTDGVPASGINPPSKAEGRAIGALIEAYIADQISAASITTPITPPGPYVMPAYATDGGIGYSTTSASAPWPAVLADDVALMPVLVYDDGGTAPDPVRPSGWTQAGSTITEGMIKAALYWKRCDGSESGSQTVLTGVGGTVSTRTAAVILTFRGCVANGDPYEALDTNHGAVASMPSRSVTTTGPERLVVNIWAAVNGGGYSLSGPDTGFTEIYSDAALTFHDSRFVADVQAAPTATTVGVDTRSLTSIFGWTCFSFALVPST